MAKERRVKNQTVFARNKFFATTSIGGFGLIQSSNSKVETIIWYIVILVFTAVTIRNLIMLTIEYNHQQPIATVSLEQWNGYINNIYISYPIFFPELYEEFHEENSYFLYPSNMSLSSDLDRAILLLNTKEKLIGKNSTWPYVLIPLMARYTFVMEGYYDACSCDPDIIFIKKKYYPAKLAPFITKLINHANHLNVTSNQLMNKWFHQVINMSFHIYSNFSVDPQPYENLQFTDFSLYQADQFEHSTQASFTVGFQLSQSHFLNQNDQWELWYGQLITIAHESGILGVNATYEDTLFWYMNEVGLHSRTSSMLSLHKDFDSFVKNKNILINAHAGNYYLHEVKMVCTFHSLNNNCSQTTPKWKCYPECMANFTIEQCHCIPRHDNINLDPNYKPCTMKDYEHCLMNNKKRMEYCSNSCPELCNQTILSFERLILAEQLGFDDTVQVRLWPANTKHPVFTETYRQTSAQFWAALGGEFNFWIGLSVIAAVHLVVYFIKQISYAFKENTKTGTNMRQMVHGLKSAQMVSALTLGMTQRPHDQQNVGKDDNIENYNQKTDRLVEELEISRREQKRLEERIQKLESRFQ